MSNKIKKVSRNTGNAPIDNASSQSVAFSHYNNISAQLPVEPKTGLVVSGGLASQAKQCLTNIKAIVESINHVMDDVVKMNIYLKDLSEVDVVDEVYRDFFHDYLPTRTTVAVADLPMSDALIQIDAIISNGEGTPYQNPCDLKKLAKNTEYAPKNTLSTHSVAFSHYNNISAQLPIDPKTGKFVTGGVKEQAKQCLRNIKSILESIDVPFDDIVKINIYLTNMSDIQSVNEVYTTFFPDSAIARAVAYLPARTVFVASALPGDALIQIDAVVSHGDGTPPQAIEDRHGIVIRANNTENAPLSSLHTQTVAFSHYNHLSAQLPIEPESGAIVSGDAKEHARQCLKNIDAIVTSIGHTMDDLVKVNIQLKSIDDVDAVNEVYKTFFEGELPARTTTGVSTLPMGALVQVDAVVSNGEGTPANR